MILTALRKMHRLPKIVVYGITARDLINNGLYCPASTPVFQYLNQCFNVGAYYPDVYNNKNNWLYSILATRLYCLRENTKLQNLSMIWCSKFLSTYVVPAKKSTRSSDEQRIMVPPSPKQFQYEVSHLPNKDKLAGFYLIEKRY